LPHISVAIVTICRQPLLQLPQLLGAKSTSQIKTPRRIDRLILTEGKTRMRFRVGADNRVADLAARLEWNREVE
jgi:hypothetical protein